MIGKISHNHPMRVNFWSPKPFNCCQDLDFDVDYYFLDSNFLDAMPPEEEHHSRYILVKLVADVSGDFIVEEPEDFLPGLCELIEGVIALVLFY